MGYVGNEPASNFASVTKDLFSGDGSTVAFTLSKAATTNGVAVFVENVRQEPTIAYAVSGTTLTFTAAPVTSSGNNIYVLHHNAPASTATHPAAQNLLAVDGTFSGNIDVDGTANLDVVDIDGALTQDGGAVFNEGSADVDFRVESNGQTHKLFVNGGEDVVCFGFETPETIGGIEAGVQIEGTDYAGGSLSIWRNANDDAGAYLLLGKSRGTAVNADTIIQDNDDCGIINFVGADGGDRAHPIASIRGAVDGTPGSNDMPGRLEFWTTTDGGTTLTERMRINAAGFVKALGNASSYDGAAGAYHEFHTDHSDGTTGFIIRSDNSSYTGRLSQFDLPPSDSTTNAKFIACYSSNPGGSADLEFYVRVDGNAYVDGSFSGGGADYAEFFEWKDGNSSNENRVGCSVVLEGNQIRKATSSDNTSNIIGVISVNPSVVGDADGEYWNGTYLKDDFGKYIFKDSEQIEWADKEGIKYSYQKDYVPSDVTVPSDAKKTPIKVRTLNPDYDKSKTYERREDRKEWDMVGMMGKLRMLKGQPTGDRWIKMRDISDTVEEWLVR